MPTPHRPRKKNKNMKCYSHLLASQRPALLRFAQKIQKIETAVKIVQEHKVKPHGDQNEIYENAAHDHKDLSNYNSRKINDIV